MQKQLNSGSIEGQSTLHIWAKRRSFQIIYERLPWINGALPLQEFLSRDICVSNLWIAMEYIENALGQLRNCSHQRGVLEEERCTRRAIRVRLMDFVTLTSPEQGSFLLGFRKPRGGGRCEHHWAQVGTLVLARRLHVKFLGAGPWPCAFYGWTLPHTRLLSADVCTFLPKRICLCEQRET